MLPVLDISNYLTDPTGPGGKKFIEKLRNTCHGPGFFYLVGHGIDSKSNLAVLDIANQFFELPLPEREALAIGNSPHFRGYTLLKHEITAGRVDWRDQIDIGPEEPATPINTDDAAWQRLRGPNQWPDSLPSMASVINSWMAKVHPLGMSLIQALAQGLGQPSDYFNDRMSPEPYTRVKVIRYPAQPVEDNSGQGLGLHHDSGIMTFILQDEVAGLQVMSNGKLIDVEPMPGAFVVNLGEMMQSATNGYLRATKHQVVSPPVGKQRISIAYFMNPRLDARFEPIELPSVLAADATGAQNNDPNDPVFATFGANTLKIRMRAHPEVTARFYSDISIDDLH